MLIRIDMK